MKRLPMNPREDADVIRTGEFPDASEPPRQYIRPVCSNCKHWTRSKWPEKYVKQWGPATDGECRVNPAVVEFEDGSHSRVMTGEGFSCKRWKP